MEIYFFSFYLQNMTGMKDTNADYEGCAAKKNTAIDFVFTEGSSKQYWNLIMKDVQCQLKNSRAAAK